MGTLRLQNELELFAAGVGAAQSLFLSIYSILNHKRSFTNVLLFLFFLAITVRLTKSILWVYLDASPIWLINLGFAAHALSGPALLLYVWYFLFRKKWSRWNWLHFIPGVLLLLALNSLSQEGFWYIGGYHGLLVHQMVYAFGSLLILGVYLARASQQIQLGNGAKTWLIVLVVGTAILQFLYFSNYILGITPYLLGPMVYLPLIYLLAFLLFKNPNILKPALVKRNGNIRLSQSDLESIADKLQEIMRTEKLYLDPNCTISTVAKTTKIQPYLISHVVNNILNQGFPDFLNTFRIEAVKQRLAHPHHQKAKIATIAYDCGFNSLSSFNTAFKKITGTTPTQFQKTLLSS